MSISVGDKLPDATLLRMGAGGPEPVDLSDRLRGRKVAIFAMPGAFSANCHAAHMPSILRTKDAFAEKGVDEIVCISVNDPFIMGAWGEATGATAAGIAMLGDADSRFTKAIGMDFTAPAIGFFDRSRRYAMVAEDGIVTVLQVDAPGVCEVATGERLLDALVCSMLRSIGDDSATGG